MRDLLDRRRQILSKTLPRVSLSLLVGGASSGLLPVAGCTHPIPLPSPPLPSPPLPSPPLPSPPLQDELKELKQLVGTKIDHGNRMLGMDLVARDENGAPLDPKKAGVMHLYKTVG